MDSADWYSVALCATISLTVILLILYRRYRLFNDHAFRSGLPRYLQRQRWSLFEPLFFIVLVGANIGWVCARNGLEVTSRLGQIAVLNLFPLALAVCLDLVAVSCNISRESGFRWHRWFGRIVVAEALGHAISSWLRADFNKESSTAGFMVRQTS
jgi:hypothetical protein